MGIKTLLQELGVVVRIIVSIDSSAALGVLLRKGLGKIRHLEVADLWMQSAVRNGKIEVVKIAGAINDADLATKPLTRQAIDTIMERLGAEYV